MSSPSLEVKFEIGHVLFIDIVGYSKLLLDKQKERLRELTQIVLAAPEVAKAENEQLVRLPTGDGMALVFRNSPEEPVRCALEIAQALKEHPEVLVRMGIHSGPVSEVTDLNGRTNIAGAGINMAQRVMDCGDSGHILLSRHVAEDLEHYPRWRRYLHPLGEVEVKHGEKISVVNFYQEELGNPDTPHKFRSLEPPGQSVPLPTTRSGVCLRRWAVGVLIGAALVFALLALIKHHRRSSSTAPNDSAGATHLPEKSIAVLPFDSLSEDKNNAFFAEGVQDEILTRLAKVADLKVIARTSTQKFKGALENLPDIARQLGVVNILEGSVQKVNDQVRVNVQLINAPTNAHLWAEIYDRKLTDIFSVESDVAKTIADTLQAKLTGSEKSALSKKPTENPEAYQLYLKGRFFWNKRTGEDLKTALGYFEQAVSADPNYAAAYAGVGDTCMLIPIFSAGTPKEYFPKSETAARKAIALDETTAEGHAALANLLFLRFKFADAEQEFRRAIEFNPNYATAHHWYSNSLLAALGRFDEAIAEGRRSVELDPLSLIINADFGSTLMVARRYDEAIVQLQRTLALDGNFYYAHWNLGETLLYKGDVPGAIKELEKAVSLERDPEALTLLGQTYIKTGRKGDGLKLLDELKEMARRRYVRPELFAMFDIALGDKTRAIERMEEEYQNQDGFDLTGMKSDQRLDPLRDEPRFRALMGKVFPSNPP